MATTSMDDILGGADTPTPEEKPAPEAPAAAEVAAPEPTEKVSSKRREHRAKEYEAQGRDPETGQFLPKAEEAKPEAKAEEKKEVPAKEAPKEEPKAAQEYTERERALLAEAARHKRRAQELEQLMAAPKPVPQAQPGAQPAQPQTLWDNPDAWKQNVEQGAQKIIEEGKRELLNMRMQFSEQMARSQYKDFDEKVTAFNELVQTTPGLGQQFLASANPAEFAYRTAQSHMELKQAGSLDKLKADIEAKARADERAKLEAEFKKRQEDAEKQRAALTPTLSDVRGAATRTAAPVWTGPTAMEDILKH